MFRSRRREGRVWKSWRFPRLSITEPPAIRWKKRVGTGRGRPQVRAFFQLSDGYPEAPYNRFYQVGCGISGKLRADGRNWTFSINGGGTATWQDGTAVRHFGCSAPGCASLLLLPTDGMEPD